MAIEVSVIIPCLNEENTIDDVLGAVKIELEKWKFSYEIIVIDNGSTDRSMCIVKQHHAELICSPAKTVAEVRNCGVDVSKGDLLVFLDADVVVQDGWGHELRNIYVDMVEYNNVITGSNCSAPTNIKPLLYSWYKGISADTRNNHLGSGHMIVSATTFRCIGGFSIDLITGEDYDFCSRAKRIGVSVVSNPRLPACHLGYPVNLIEFSMREMWHGEGDCSNFKVFMRSKVAICGFFFLVLNLIALLCALYKVEIFFILLMLIVLIVVFVNYYKFKYVSFLGFVYRSVVCYFYLMFRGLALPCFVLKRHVFLYENIEDEK